MAGAKAKTKKKPPEKTAARGKPKAPVTAKPKSKSAARREGRAKAAPPNPRQSPLQKLPRNRLPNRPPRSRPAAPAFIPAAKVVRLPTKPLQKGDFVLDKLQQVALTATNLDVSVDFYRDVLGLSFIARYDPPGLAFFALGSGTRLLLSATASQATLYFAVDKIDAAVGELKKRGVTFLHPPAMVHRDVAGEFGKKDVEEWMAFFRDPSGNLLGLVERR